MGARREGCRAAARVAALLAACAPAAQARQLVVAGPASSLTENSASWSWDGGDKVAPFRAALQDPQLFGPAGVVGESVVTLDLPVIGAASLAGVDVFVSPWWADAETPPDAAAAVVDFFLSGGSLLLWQDDSEHDRIGELLGVETMAVEADGTPSNGPPPVFDGAFGVASDVAGFGNEGQISPVTLNLLGGTANATNASGQITSALWLPGQYAPGAGTLLVVADVDTMASTQASYAPLNDNGVFTLNAMSLLAFEGEGSASVYGCGLNPPGSMSVVSGTANLGETIVFGVDNPVGSQGPGSLSYVAVSSAPDPLHPCGGPLPGLGMGFPGQAAELLISLVPPDPFTILVGGRWSGPGEPAEVPLEIPFNPAFVQLTFYGQGILFDPFATFGIGPALTDAVEVTVGVSG